MTSSAFGPPIREPDPAASTMPATPVRRTSGMLPEGRAGPLKDVAEHREVGDVTTLADSTVIDLLKVNAEEASSEGLTQRGPDRSGFQG